MTPHEKFGDMPVCPFLKAELNTMSIVDYNPDYYPNNDLTLLDIAYQEMENHSSVLIIQRGDNLENINREKYQSYINGELSKRNHTADLKSICFSPYEKHTIAGVDTREHAPTFLINITTHDALAEAHEKLKSSDYFKYFSEEDKKMLETQRLLKLTKEDIELFESLSNIKKM